MMRNLRWIKDSNDSCGERNKPSIAGYLFRYIMSHVEVDYWDFKYVLAICQ